MHHVQGRHRLTIDNELLGVVLVRRHRRDRAEQCVEALEIVCEAVPQRFGVLLGLDKVADGSIRRVKDALDPHGILNPGAIL